MSKTNILGEEKLSLYPSFEMDENVEYEWREAGVHPITIREHGKIPRSMQHTSSVIHHELQFPEFDFHSLRHTHATHLGRT